MEHTAVSMSIVNLNPVETKNWNDRILKTGQYSIFHSREWAIVLINSYQYSPHFFCWIENGNISSVMPFMEVNSKLTGRRGVSLPFSDSCNPIVNKTANAHELIDMIAGYARKLGWQYVDFHGGENLFTNHSPSIQYLGHRLELSQNLDGIFSTFRSNTRRNIRKAMNSKVKISFGNSMEDMDEFYRLHCITRKRHRLPAQPFFFFRNIFTEIIQKKLGILLCASYRGQIFAAAVFFHFGDKALFKFGASDKNLQHLRGNDLLIWEAIKWYASNGYKSISLGRTGIQHSGLRRFKLGWGVNEYRINYYRYDLKNGNILKIEDGKLAWIMNIVFNKMPIPISRIFGQYLYKHFA